MKKKVSLLVCTASLFVAFPVLAQSRAAERQGDHGNHNPRGNGSDHTGHDENGSGGGQKGDKGDKGDKKGSGRSSNLVLADPVATAAVATAATSVTAALRVGSLTTPKGALIAAAAQGTTYDVLTADAALASSSAKMSSAFSAAGPEATAVVPSLISSVSGLSANPSQLPSAITEYNRFTRVASNAFIANPPPEFVALHTVLARLTVAAGSAK